MDELLDPEAPIPADLSLPEVEEANPWPAPLITSRDEPPADLVWPERSMATLEKRAKLAGWDARRTYSLGFKPGRTKGSWVRLEEAVVRLQRPGSVRWAYTWERSPDTTAKGGPAWKAALALEGDTAGHVRAWGHVAAKAML